MLRPLIDPLMLPEEAYLLGWQDCVDAIHAAELSGEGSSVFVGRLHGILDRIERIEFACPAAS